MTTTARAGFRKPDLVDGPSIATAVGDAIDDVDYISIPIYPTTAARLAANPSPVQGQMAYITDLAVGGRVLTSYNGAAWVNYYPGGLFVSKSLATSRAATTSLAADPELSIPVAANTTYEFEALFFVAGNSAADFKFNFTFPSSDFAAGLTAPGTTYGATSTDGVGTWTSTLITAGTVSATFACGITDTTIPLTCLVNGILKVGSSAGAFYLSWAQNSSNATATALGANSYMLLDRVA